MLQPISPITEYISQEPCDSRGTPKTKFRAGEDLFYIREAVVLKTVARTLHAYLVNTDMNAVFVRLPQSSGIVPTTGPFRTIFKALTLPRDLPPGNYAFKMTIFYELNVLRGTIAAEAPPILFVVVK